MNSSKQAVVC